MLKLAEYFDQPYVFIKPRAPGKTSKACPSGLEEVNGKYFSFLESLRRADALLAHVAVTVRAVFHLRADTLSDTTSAP